MPYIPQADRDRLFDTQKPLTAGELNYLLTLTLIEESKSTEERLFAMLHIRIVRFFNAVERRYQAHNDVAGALYNAYREYVRRTGKSNKKIFKVIDKLADYFYNKETAPYEDLAILKNGDVYSDYL